MPVAEEIRIELPHKFTPRPYQNPLWDYMTAETDATKKWGDRRAGKRAVTVWHRRTGKDKTDLADHIIPAMAERVGAYHYYFPTAADGRAILWDGMDREGLPFLSHFPKDFIAHKNESQMKIKTVNGSLFQIIGTDRTERVGTNPVGAVFSEFSKQNPRWWDLVRPILAENGGWAIFNWTPRGKNHAYRLDRMARANPKWFYQMLTVDDTHAISLDAIEDDRKSGMSEEMIQQEYYCSYNIGVEGSYFGRAMGALWERKQICNVIYDVNSPVHTAWDLGYGDSTAIWFFQIIGLETHLIDYYENQGEGMSHYVRVLNEKKDEHKYQYGKHFAPHDVKAGSLATGQTLIETAAGMDLEFYTLQREHDVDDGIERVRKMLPHCWFDQIKCQAGIDALENYHKEYREKANVYASKPFHDWASHGADAFRYLSMAAPQAKSGSKSKSDWKALKEQYA